MRRDVRRTSGASVHGDYPAAYDCEPSTPIPVSRRPAQADDDIGGHILDLERHAAGGDTRTELDADDHWADRQTGAFAEDPFA